MWIFFLLIALLMPSCKKKSQESISLNSTKEDASLDLSDTSIDNSSLQLFETNLQSFNNKNIPFSNQEFVSNMNIFLNDEVQWIYKYLDIANEIEDYSEIDFVAVYTIRIHEFLNALIGQSPNCTTPLCIFINNNRELLLTKSSFLKTLHDQLISQNMSSMDDENSFVVYNRLLSTSIDIQKVFLKLMNFLKIYSNSKNLQDLLTPSVLNDFKYLKFIAECSAAGSQKELRLGGSVLKEIEVSAKSLTQVEKSSIDNFLESTSKISNIFKLNLDRLPVKSEKKLPLDLKYTSKDEKTNLSSNIAALKKARNIQREKLNAAQTPLDDLEKKIGLTEKRKEFRSLQIQRLEMEISDIMTKNSLTKEKIVKLSALRFKESDLWLLKRKLENLKSALPTPENKAGIKKLNEEIQAKEAEIASLGITGNQSLYTQMDKIQRNLDEIEKYKEGFPQDATKYSKEDNEEISAAKKEIKELEIQVQKSGEYATVNGIQSQLEKTETALKNMQEQQKLVKLHDLYTQLSDEQKKIVNKIYKYQQMLEANPKNESYIKKMKALLSSWEKLKEKSSGFENILENPSQLNPK